MKYSVAGRTRKVNRLLFKIIPRIVLFKLCSPLLPSPLKSKIADRLHEKTAKQVVASILELEGLFIKVGQLISTFSSVLPKAYVDAFQQTQSHSTARPFDQIKERIESELNASIDSTFLSIDETPIGTASIGQVHKGVLLNGDDVAIKVQHLNIEKIAELDLQLIEKILRLSKYIFNVNGIDTAFKEIVSMVHQELDYKKEASYMQAISDNFKNDIRVIIPTVYSNYSTSKVLVLQFAEGVKITNQEHYNKYQLSKEDTAKNLLEIFSQSILFDGIYHADPHPGNILINDTGQIVLLDFGAVGTLNAQMKEGLFILMQAAILKDENQMIEGFKKMGFISNVPGVNLVCKKIIRLLNDYLQNEIKIEKINLNEIDINKIDISKLLELIKNINLKELENIIRVPNDWVLLNRSVMLVLGITSELAPELDSYKIVKPKLMSMFTKKENLSTVLKTSIQQQVLRLITIPRKIETLVDNIESGAIEVNIKNRKTEVKLIYHLIQQLIFTLGAGFCYYFYTIQQQSPLLYATYTCLALAFRSFVFSLLSKRKLK